MDVVVVGSCMIDLISYAPRLPQSGETLLGTKFESGFGGKGANQCVAAAKLGSKSLLVARVGTDNFGEEYWKSLQSMGVASDHLKLTKDCSSGMAQIIVADSGENQIVIVPGANTLMSVDDVRAAKNHINECKVLITQMEIPVETTIEALRVKKSSGKGISIFNAAPAQSSLPSELYTLPTIFCVNETEAQQLAGCPLNNVQEAFVAVEKLRQLGCNHVIITLGADGAVYSEPGQKSLHIPSAPVKAIDTTGAGDAFIGALAFYISKKGFQIRDAVDFACQVAAISVQLPGTQKSFPKYQDLPSQLK